jgi:microcystin degradation protein MlrC
VNAYIGYRTNPHLDMRERGIEAAQMLRRLILGTRTYLSHIRLPIVPPTVTMLTGQDATNRPYGELIDLGQQRMREPPWSGRVLNVSVMGGFAFADTPFNGLTVVVTALDQAAADGLACELAKAGWARREQFQPRLTRLEDATAQAKTTEDKARHALIFADVADNPGGGGRGNTMGILDSFLAAGVQNGLVGVIHDPALAAEAHVRGYGTRFLAQFNREGGDAFSKPFAADATVVGLRDQAVRGRRGIYANNTLDLGLAAALRIGGLTVVVISNRMQCADPVFFEMFGLDIAAVRVVVVKSRGHFRGGFDEFFRHQDVVEVDAPGLTSPILSRFAWRHMPRPVMPIDETASWDPPSSPTIQPAEKPLA